MKPPHLTAPPSGPPDEQKRVVAEAVAQAYHDLSNPAAVLSGNVQFLQAVAGGIQDPDALAAIADLSAGIVRLEEEMARIAHLREQLREWAEG
jgi:hypothetical protein